MFYWDVATGRVIRKFRGHGSEVIFFEGCLMSSEDMLVR